MVERKGHTNVIYYGESRSLTSLRRFEVYQPLPAPPFFDPKHASDPYYRPDMGEIIRLASTWRAQHGIRKAQQKTGIALFNVDPNKTFNFPPPWGALFVAGRSGRAAIDDTATTAQFIYRNLAILDKIFASLDAHPVWAVFNALAHLTRGGDYPTDFTVIPADDYASGKYHANPVMAEALGASESFLNRQWLYYCQEIERLGRERLTIWPTHGLLGEFDQGIVGLFDEARMFHSIVRGVQNPLILKGQSSWTENLSVFRPDVSTFWNGKPIPGASPNRRLIRELAGYLAVIMVGQAGSHCQGWSTLDLLDMFYAIDPTFVSKVYILADCTSAVVTPYRDYTDQMLNMFDEYRNRGAHVVKSTDPMASWPGVIGQIASEYMGT